MRYLILLILLLGCGPAPKPPTWKIELIRPNGEVHKVYHIVAEKQPRIEPRWGGQLEIYSGKRNIGLLAPTGWAFDITKDE